jgi:hypothetical protein
MGDRHQTIAMIAIAMIAVCAISGQGSPQGPPKCESLAISQSFGALLITP